MNYTKHHILAISLIIAFSIIIYFNTIHLPFHYDDKPHIVTNRHIHIDSLSLSGLIDAGIKSIASRRPIANISFAINYYYGRLDPLGYHIINILIHIITGITIYLFLDITLTSYELRVISYKLKDSPPTLPSPSRGDGKGWIPLIATLLWVTSPVQTEAVTYIIQRMTSMATMFYMLSLFCYVKGRIRSKIKNQKSVDRKIFKSFSSVFCLLSSVFFALLAFGTKEISVTLPIVIILYEIYFFARFDPRIIKRRLIYFGIIIIPLIIISLLYLNTGDGVVEELRRLTDKSLIEQQGLTAIERLLTEFRVVIYYITLLILPLPSRLRLVYDFPVSGSLIDPVTTILSLFTILGLVIYALLTVRKRPIISFFIIWFFLNLVIESSIITILHIVFEHRLYLPSIGLFVVLTVGMMDIWQNAMPIVQGLRLTTHRSKPVAPILFLFSILILTQSLWTIQRNSVWRDEISLWRDTVEKSPDLALPHYNLGNAYRRKNNLELAIKEYQEALRIRPDYYEAHYNLGTAYRYYGEMDLAIKEYQEVLKLIPNHYGAYNNLGKVYIYKGELRQAIKEFQEVIRLKPDHLYAHINLGNIYRDMGMYDLAIREYREALRIDPESVEIRENIDTMPH